MPTRILAIDTTSEWGSLALAENGVLVEEVPLYSPDGFGHILFPQIEALVKRYNWTFDRIDCYAAAAGPGSFTGVRVGIAAAKGLAEAANAKAAAISNLKAMATFSSAAIRAPFLDARRGEIYGGVFDHQLRHIQAEAVCPLKVWLSSLPQEAELLTPDPLPFPGLPVVQTPRAIAAAIAALAAQEMHDPAAVDANYVRRSDAEQAWTDR